MIKLEILKALREAGDAYVSGQDICNQLGVSRTAVWKAVKQLEKEGYKIQAVQNRGYRLEAAPDSVGVNELTSILQTRWLGKKIYYYDTIDSTNTEAKRLAEEGADHGALIIANEQTGGRGRRGRGFQSKAGDGIFMTLLLKPKLFPNKASMLTLVAGLAVIKGLERATGVSCQIKWPNDVVIGGRKLVGVLTEMSAQVGYINYVVVGIGINVKNKSFPDELASVATSLYIETKKNYRRAQIIEAVMEEFEDYYERFVEAQTMAPFIEEYNDHLVNRNKKVKVLDPEHSYEGIARGMNEAGELLVETEQGMVSIASGEVSVRGVYGYV